MTFFFIGILDLLAGIIITFSSAVFFGDVAKYIGYILIVKGIWSILSDIGYILGNK